MSSNLTSRQQAILDFVSERIATQGMPPTWAEIARAFGFRQTRAAQKHLQALEAKGHLTLLPGKARGIRLTSRLGRPDDNPSRGTRFKSTRSKSTRSDNTHPPAPTARQRNQQLRLPILGRVAAGLPIGADAEVQRHLLLDRHLFSSTPDYLLRVQGDSMREDGILDGDLVAVQRATQARDGQTVVARLDDEITIKRLHLTADRIRLLPRNPDYTPIEIMPGQDFAIEGVYCGLIREG